MKKILNFICFVSFICCATGVFAQSTVTGKVTDQDGIGILGANVQVQGTNTGSVTDDDGNYSIQASQGDILIFSYIGFQTQRVEVTGLQVNVQLKENVSLLNEVVVSSTRKPVRKLQATTSINSVGIEQIESKQPESFTEAIENTPGVTVDNSSGRKGTFRIRGFPGGNTYTTTLIDGLPASGTANLSGGTQEFYGIDPNVERIEVVRGAAATLFGRAAAAGAVNIISRTGGEKHSGSFSFLKYNNVAGEGHQYDGDVDFRADWNLNGPLSDKLRYNVGGYVINDSGNKEQANKDVGAQIRANVDWMIGENSNIRISGAYFNNQFQNVTDAVFDLETGEIAEGWSTRNVFYNDPRQLFNLNGIVAAGGEPVLDADGDVIRNNPADNREETTGGNVSIDGLFDLGNGWSINQKLKYQDIQFDDINEIGLTGFFTAESSILRFQSGARNQVRDIISETRFSKFIEGDKTDHNISFGLYLSDSQRDRLGINYLYRSNISPRPTFFGGFFGPPAPLSNNSSISGTTSHREEKSTGIFIGDEMVINEKLSINVGFRYDWLTASFSNNPERLRRRDIDFDPAETLVNEQKFNDYSGSIGANYLIGENSAIYANYLRAFSLNAVTNINQVEIEDNEVINNLEIGYRAGLGDLTIDATFFNTQIDNRLASVFDADLAEFVQRPAGSNKIIGGEIALSYTPKAIQGLLISGSYTRQNSEYEDFIIPLSTSRATGEVNADLDNLFGLNLVENGTAINVGGLQVQETPRNIYNILIAYNRDRWGLDFSGFSYTGAFGDIFNLYDKPNISIFNVGSYVTFPMGADELRLSLRIKNIFDNASPQDLFVSSADDSVLLERQNNPDPTGRLAWSTFVNPKRVLFTIGYKF
ncbi:TonB-dependent receptor [uncultured Croceitalea sp.]|uniref:TonB-dependent receptor n=1 Tax=uncultured Croceitalea sp. TaxID=1798908 RepID=UPI00374EED00